MKTITVKSVLELTPAQKARLEEGIQKKKKEKVAFCYEVDKFLGGIVVIDGENYIDASYANDLRNIRLASKEVINEICIQNPQMTADEVAKKVNEKLVAAFSGKTEKSDTSSRLSANLSVSNCGKVTNVSDGIVTLSGLSSCKNGELLRIGTNTYAIAMNLEASSVGAMLINNTEEIVTGDMAYATGKIAEIPVGDVLLGRVINPLGKPIDGLPSFVSKKTGRLEAPAPGITDRGKVQEPLYTGTLAVDAMVPIGKGQRELIIGDRQTGKTALAIDAILNQKNKNVKCIYVAIGQRAGVISDIIDTLKKHEAMEYTVVVASTADDSAPLQYLAPFAGCSVAEEFMYNGKDVLIIYDDLSKHAVAYRAISLLLKRPAGREAYPGDIFYLHSRLLERAAKLSEKLGGGSMTALPIVETQEGDISSYIPTNVISITDGQIYLEKELFRAGVRPAINVGLSVSRVGGAAQSPGIRKLSSKLRLDLAHHRELAVFAQFGSELDASTRKILLHGEKATEALKQPVHRPRSKLREILYLYLIVNEHLLDVETPEITDFMQQFYDYFHGSYPTASKKINKTGALDEQLIKDIDEAISQFKPYYQTK